jgi:hypothetical protein
VIFIAYYAYKGVASGIIGLFTKVLRACLVRDKVGFREPEIGFPRELGVGSAADFAGQYPRFRSTPGEESSIDRFPACARAYETFYFNLTKQALKNGGHSDESVGCLTMSFS